MDLSGRLRESDSDLETLKIIPRSPEEIILSIDCGPSVSELKSSQCINGYVFDECLQRSVRTMLA